VGLIVVAKLMPSIKLKQLVKAVLKKASAFVHHSEPISTEILHEPITKTNEELPGIITIEDKVIAVVRIPSTAKTLPASGKDLRKRL
jgi:hypothetical protein